MQGDYPHAARLDNAGDFRRTARGPHHHSNCGGQYASDAYMDRLADLGFFRLMSSKGNCYDNAATEPFWGSLKF